MIRRKNGDGIWLFEARQVIEVSVLPIFVFYIGVANGSRRSRKNCYAAANAFH